jgi:two-component system NarL family sensor kinase
VGISLLFNIGHYSFMLHNYNEAEEAWLKAYEDAQKLEVKTYALRPLYGLSSLYKAKGDFNKAYHYQQLFSSLSDDIVNEKQLKEANILEHKYRLALKEKKLAQQRLKAAEQKAITVRQNLLMAGSILGILLSLLFYFIIKRNNKRKQLLMQEQTNTLKKETELAKMKALMNGEEEERKRVALELHDDIGSMLSMAKLNLSVVRDQYRHHANAKDISEVMHLLDRSSSVLRSTAHILMPEMLLRSGIDHGLHELCRKTALVKGIPIEYQSYGLPVLSKEREKRIFRILQEMLLMIIPYSNPSHLLLQLNWQEQIIYVTLEASGAPESQEWPDKGQAEAWDLLQRKIEASRGIITIDQRAGKATVWDLEFGEEPD